MKVMEEELRWYYGCWEFVRIRDEFCSEWVNERFVLPMGTETIWLSLHTKPSRNRYRVRVGPPKEGTGILVWMGRDAFGDKSLNDLLRPYFGKWLYLECRYEA